MNLSPQVAVDTEIRVISQPDRVSPPKGGPMLDIHPLTALRQAPASRVTAEGLKECTSPATVRTRQWLGQNGVNQKPKIAPQSLQRDINQAATGVAKTLRHQLPGLQMRTDHTFRRIGFLLKLFPRISHCLREGRRFQQSDQFVRQYRRVLSGPESGLSIFD